MARDIYPMTALHIRWGRVTNGIMYISGTLVTSANGTHPRGNVWPTPIICPSSCPCPGSRSARAMRS